jgi:eukaryotic-like serine/threonine-protein kinase
MNKLGKYEIRRTLGKGAMGIVYEGFDPVIERTVAIKTILPSQLNGAEFVGVMARFKREAQAAGRLNHPGIVAIYDYGEEVAQDVGEDDATMMAPKAAAPQERVAYIAMEFIKGRELRDFFEKGERFPMPEVVRIMSEMLDALDHAHSQGVVHRDMKPANLILLENGRVKVADFGIARVEASELTQTGTVLGTPSYMSPEQFMGHPVDGRSDLFSCGVILYQLLTGEKPFTGESTTTIMYKVLREEPVPPSQLNLSLAPALDAVMKKALAKNPGERFQSGREFAQALQAAVAAPNPVTTAASAPAVAIPVINMGPLQDPPAAMSKPSAASTVPAASRSRAVPAGAWAVCGAALIAVAAGAYVVLAPGRGSAPAATVAQAPATSTPAAAPVAAPAAAPAVAAANAPAPAPGTLVISALGVVDPQDARFGGNMAAAQVEARNDAKRQLVEKALALYVDKASLDSHHALIETKLLANSGNFIRSVLQEDAAGAAKGGGTVEMQTRAVVSLRDVQRSLNQLSREERVEFIRNKGDPRISIRIDIGNADGTAMAPARSQLAENVVKDRIKSFGFRVWAPEGDNSGSAQAADFAIKGEVKVKQLSMKLPASGLTITKTALTSWTLKAIETATGEEVYLSTKLPTGQSWASEDQALAEIGKLVGDEFSRNFFLQHFEFRTQKTNLMFTGLPEGGSGLLLRELRGMRAVLDAQAAQEAGRFQVQLAEGSAPDLVQDAIVRPLNAKLGLDCFALAGTAGSDVTIAYSATCATPQMRTKLESGPPAGWLRGPQAASPAPAKTTVPAGKAT